MTMTSRCSLVCGLSIIPTLNLITSEAGPQKDDSTGGSLPSFVPRMNLEKSLNVYYLQGISIGQRWLPIAKA